MKKSKLKKITVSALSVLFCAAISFNAAACSGGGQSGTSASGSSSSSASSSSSPVAQPEKPVKLDVTDVSGAFKANTDKLTEADLESVLGGEVNGFSLLFKGITAGDVFVAAVSELQKAIDDGTINGDAQSEINTDDLPSTPAALAAMLKSGVYSYGGSTRWYKEREMADGSVELSEFDTFSNALFNYSLASVGNKSETLKISKAYLNAGGGNKNALDSLLGNFFGAAMKSEAIITAFKSAYPDIDSTVVEWLSRLTVYDVYNFTCGDFSSAEDITYGDVLNLIKNVLSAENSSGGVASGVDGEKYDLTAVYEELGALIGDIKIRDSEVELKKITLYAAVDSFARVAQSTLGATKADADAFCEYIKSVYAEQSNLGGLVIKSGKTVDYAHVTELFKKLVPQNQNA